MLPFPSLKAKRKQASWSIIWANLSDIQANQSDIKSKQSDIQANQQTYTAVSLIFPTPFMT